MKNFYTATAVSTLALLGAITSASAWAERAKPGSYMIDPAHTTVTFSASHLGTSDLAGRFNTIEGNFTLAPKGNSKVEVTIDTASVDTNHEKRDVHLRSPDFFNAKQYPKIKFISSKVHFSNGELEKIEGKLSLHGKTQSVTLAVEAVGAGADPWGGYRAGYRVATVIKRSDFGMDFMQGGIGDDIKLSINIEAIKQ